MGSFKRTKIVATIGPACEDKETLKEMIDSGMNVARLNFSHGSHEEQKVKIETIKEVRKQLGLNIAILLDTKGPEIRTGKFYKPEILINEGQIYNLTTREMVGNEEMCSVTYKDITHDLSVGDRVLIDDGLIELETLEIIGDGVKCIVKNTGILKDNRGVNLPGVKLNLPSITEKDYGDIIFGIENEVDFIAASFVRKASDVEEIRTILKHNGGSYIRIIAKIENGEGIENIDEIIEASDGIMVARGDLGVEIPQEQVPLVQKKIIKKCNAVGKPVITATQMLDSMIRNPRPTRAEVADVANAIFDGTDAIMLSGETAVGKYPVEAVKSMSKIAITVEENIDFEEVMRRNISLRDESITNAIGHATVASSYGLKARAILAPTASGGTPMIISKFRPKAPIFATTSNEEVARRLALSWGVECLVIESADTERELFIKAIEALSKREKIRKNDVLIITAGLPVGIEGNTNMMRIHIVGREI
ncbi:MAG: pyruvate kinase [Peptostreptococcaceae bacterium]|nr:pyruvate kinase [Peptostreptococcaceae bacterium]